MVRWRWWDSSRSSYHCHCQQEHCCREKIYQGHRWYESNDTRNNARSDSIMGLIYNIIQPKQERRRGNSLIIRICISLEKKNTSISTISWISVLRIRYTLSSTVKFNHDDQQNENIRFALHPVALSGRPSSGVSSWMKLRAGPPRSSLNALAVDWFCCHIRTSFDDDATLIIVFSIVSPTPA